MTKQAKSSEEILSIFHNEDTPEGFTLHTPPVMLIRGAAIMMYRKAESEHLPIINQQAEEIEKLEQLRHKYFELQDKIVPQLNEEVKKLKGQGITTLNDYREEVKMRLEAQTERDALQSRFDGLLKELEGVERYDEMGDYVTVIRPSVDGSWVAHSDIQSIIKQARGSNG